MEENKLTFVECSDRPGFVQLRDDNRCNIFSKGNIELRFDVNSKPFARGKFATVKNCTDKNSKCEFAAKVIRKRRRGVDVLHEIIHEIAILSEATPSPRIVQLEEVFDLPCEVIIVLEFLRGGELQTVLDLEESLPEQTVIRFITQILEGLQFLHSRNIAHLDIKPQNILLTDKYPNTSVKICDFGLSRYVKDNCDIREILGTPDYVAPEILNYEPISISCDIWSVGVLAYVMLSGYSPFAGDSKQETLCNITQGKLEFPHCLFSGISADALNFIKSSCSQMPSIRPDAACCLTMTWLSLSAKKTKSQQNSCSKVAVLKDKSNSDNCKTVSKRISPYTLRRSWPHPTELSPKSRVANHNGKAKRVRSPN